MENPGTFMRTLAIRRTVLGDGRPKICVPLTARSLTQLEEQLNRLRQVPCDMTELRADYLDQAELDASLEQILAQVRRGIGERVLVFTIRTKREGGLWDPDYDLYRRWNLRAAEGGADLVDLELFTVLEGEKEGLKAESAPALIAQIHAKGCRVIGSSHDFEKTPETEEMIRRLMRMQELGMDLTKLAVMPRSRQDVVRLLDVSVRMLEEIADRPFVTMSMGKTGLISRCIGGFDGSAFTFASAAEASAPGQIPAEEMARVLKTMDEIF